MSLQLAFRSLVESWPRTVLSALGIMVASIAILLLVSIGLGVEKDIRGQVDELGANVLVAVPGRVDLQSMSFNPNMGGQSWFREEDAARLETVPGVREVATLCFAGGGIRAGEKEAYPMMIATTSNWFDMHQVSLESGRLFTDAEEDKQVAVLGSVARFELFGEEDPVGRTVQINGADFRIIGVMSSQAAESSLFSMQSFQNVAYIPYAAQRRLSPDMQIDRFMIQASPEAEPKSLVTGLESRLGERLDRQQFSVLTQEDLLGLIYKVMGILGTLVVGLTSIALLVGALGILTVMVMSVNERRKEIGVMKALGATQSDVFRQFLWESIIIGLIGVTAGLGFSLVVNWGLATFTAIKPLMTPGTVALAFGIGLGVGAAAGLIPAMRAARQDPVVSLRNE
ncbi:MAG: ABC transporter permease [Fimbriimonadaceae bacterium]|nr:ABC transporter permease [Fimbriimonadaceae bacterium]